MKAMLVAWLAKPHCGPAVAFGPAWSQAAATLDQGRPDGFEGQEANWSRIEIESKDEDWSESRYGVLGECKW